MTLGQHRGGQVGGELEQRGGAGLTGADAELAQTLGQLVGADGASGAPHLTQEPPADSQPHPPRRHVT